MALLTVEDVKPYLRIEATYTEEDDLIEEFIAFSKAYLLNAGIAEIDNPVYRLAQKIIIDDRYNHRGSFNISVDANNALSPLMTQLQRAETITSRITPATEVVANEKN